MKLERIHISSRSSKAARAFEKLVAMGQRLLSVIKKNEGCPNKDLDRFAREIQSLCVNGTEKTDNRKTAAES